MNPQNQPLVPPSPTGVFSGPPYAKLPRSYKGVRRVLVVVVVVGILAGAAYFVYQKYLSPQARAYATSDTYMQAMTSDNPDWAAYLSSTDTAPSSLESAAGAVKGTYTLTSKTEQSGAYYALYKLSNPANQYARTIVIKTAKGYRVSSFLYSSDQLALIPGQPVVADTAAPTKTKSKGLAGIIASGGTTSGAAASTAAKSASSTPTASGGHTVVHGVTSGTVAACLSTANYASVFDDGDPGDGSTWTTASPYSAEVDFNPGDTSYTDDVEIGDLLADWGHFSQAFPTKNYTIHLQASATAGSSLADTRVSTVRSQLTSNGASSSKLVVDGAQNVDTTDTNPDADLSPFVILSVIPGNGC